MKRIFIRISILGFSLLFISNLSVFLFSRFPHKGEYLVIGLMGGFFAFIILTRWQKISSGFKWVLAFIGSHALISIVLSFIIFQKFTRTYLPVSLKEFLRNVNFIVHLPSKIYLGRVVSSISKVDVVSLTNAYHPLIKTLLDFAYAGIMGIIACQFYKKISRKAQLKTKIV